MAAQGETILSSGTAPVKAEYVSLSYPERVVWLVADVFVCLAWSLFMDSEEMRSGHGR